MEADRKKVDEEEREQNVHSFLYFSQTSSYVRGDGETGLFLIKARDAAVTNQMLWTGSSRQPGLKQRGLKATNKQALELVIFIKMLILLLQVIVMYS